MLARVLEPEVMDTLAEAVDYDAMDHTAVNRVFADDLLTALGQCLRDNEAEHRSRPLQVLDVGTGTAQIPIELARRRLSVFITGIDLAGEMLRLGRDNVATAGLQDVITLELVDAKQLPYPTGRFDCVMSNSIVHHIPEPLRVLAEMWRVLTPGGLLFVRDLMRPETRDDLDRLVALHAADANPHQRQMFADSLHAALTVGEVAALLQAAGLPADWVRPTSDRHWTICGIVPQ